MNNRLAVQHINVAHEARETTFNVRLSSAKHRATITVVDPKQNLVKLQCWSHRDSRHPFTKELTVQQIRKGMSLPLTATATTEPVFITRIERPHNGVVNNAVGNHKQKGCVRRRFNLLMSFSR